MSRQDEIARIAYDLYQRRGCIDGRELDDWCEAEQIVAAKYITIEALTVSVAVPAETDGKAKAAKPKAGTAEKKKAALAKPAKKATAPKRKQV